MFKGFISWLDSYISREEPSAVLKALIGLMAFAGLLGTIFGNQAIRAGAFATVTIFVVSVILALLADRRRLKHAYDTHRTLLARYCDYIVEHSAEPLVAIETWQQRLYVQPNGDVREVLTLKAVALREEVYFIRLPAGSGWDQPERYRRDVKISARTLTINGMPGPRWHVTTSWRSSTMMVIPILHLHHPIKRGEEVTFEVIRSWPAKCLPLVRGEVDAFLFKTTSLLEIRHVDYSIVLPIGFEAVYELIGSNEPDVQIFVSKECDQDGRQVIVCRTDKVPTTTAVGIKLELKQPVLP